ncbi:hypothetical protein [Paractinoplanes rishiriensis]|uniref:Uncharacterized protein n=1 Tax=Paractinoplanes rishiriensis TaxID=1050105 RepID=A0A919N1J0_9ACTN|nr:hypothetical protein [Actinoplanes rishiriensis]GIF01586.1 hypothetical protein Ari01nite_90500 [Actinoplanes rishiriensis]
MSANNTAAGSASEAALIEKISSVMGRIQTKTTELQGSINAKLPLLPDSLQGRIFAGWNTFCDFLGRVWNNLAEVCSNMGSPSQLWSTADAWSDTVGAPVSAQVQSADAGLLQVDTAWDGDAADAYRQTLPLQKTALEKVQSVLTSGISTALNDVAKAIIVFWGALLGALVALAAGIIGALSSAATIFGLPAAPVIAAGAGLTASAALIVGAEALKSACASANNLLRQKLADNAGFHQGHWPPAAKA